jgi:hypothetical protein
VDLGYASENLCAFNKGSLEGAALEGLYFGIELENSVVDIDDRLNDILRRGQDLCRRDWRAESDGWEEKEGE